MQIFLDCDGVLADFNTAATVICGTPPRQAADRQAAEKLWSILRAQPEFFTSLPKMPDADELVCGVRALGFVPAILTGTPRWEEAATQKLRWGQRHFPELKMITCHAAQKYRYGQPGDVLIDDWEKYRSLWEQMGGHFILHRNAAQSLAELRRLVAAVQS